MRNISLEPLSAVTFTLIGGGSMALQAPVSLPPGASATLVISGRALERDTVLIVRWRRDNGDEYLWRASF